MNFLMKSCIHKYVHVRSGGREREKVGKEGDSGGREKRKGGEEGWETCMHLTTIAIWTVLAMCVVTFFK